jgi:hypothetical protein
MLDILFITANIIVIGLGFSIGMKLYNDKIKTISISHDKIQIDFKLLQKRLDAMTNETSNETSNEMSNETSNKKLNYNSSKIL